MTIQISDVDRLETELEKIKEQHGQMVTQLAGLSDRLSALEQGNPQPAQPAPAKFNVGGEGNAEMQLPYGSMSSNTPAKREWLLSPESNWLLEPLNIDVTVREWVRKGCKLARGRWERIDKQNDRDWSKYYSGNKREK